MHALGAHTYMSTRTYDELPDEFFERSFDTYRELCSKTPRVWFTLLVGVLGQGFAWASLFEVLLGRPLIWLATALAYTPFVIYMVLVFFNAPPPMTTRTYRRILLIVVAWSVSNAAVAIITAPIWSKKAPGGGWLAVAVLLACILVGLSPIVTIVRYHNKFRSHELAFGYSPDHHERGA